ncbi:Extradiol ring-cleavage dioxygenase, class III enzyme, subunit B [Rhizorhabdus wittichii RW1]|uniref:Extradiol ring-cleavage dioxygenase, class III enzyme, subunit B n=1 Tax=Rhizorhabdus wittichii (strain DSM 6014 / CCUG 31198 / JCM 15750 / NBRC 105917 / EY 4224 / RW1) TaxID=392499 RepID=A0A9J9HDJ8_RHIWR|nr:Extradiol ring-cleavage dioxygenase, class III enzyme, subunit B [Rhizorhabdus wittichii RW1]
MAEIVLGIWTTHGPTLSTTPEQWLLRLPADRARGNHHFRGATYDFDALVALRDDERLAEQASLVERTRRAEACQAAIRTLADIYERARIDVAVIFGNDQHELFTEALMPAFTIFNGPTIWNEPASAEQARKMAPGIHEAEAGHNPEVYTEYPGAPELADHIIRQAVSDQFDVTRCARLPEQPGHWNSGIGHAFGFVYRRIMRDRVAPNVPIVTNTFFPPNQPSARRCFELGRSVARAIRSWPGDARVAVFGSGGMSHFVIDEAFDRHLFDALQARDAEALCTIGEEHLQSGTSELKNWIAAAGCLFDTPLSGGIVDYQPCYRSEAGTGTANGFMAWTQGG